MNKEFVTYEQAVALKELGFNEPCVCFYDEDIYLFSVREQDDIYDYWTPAPSYSQSFRWFREKHGHAGFIELIEPEYGGDYGYAIYYKLNHLSVDHWNKGFKTYEEAELSCLNKLIEIVKNDNTSK